MPVKWFCIHCHREIKLLNGEWIHKEFDSYICNPDAKPEHQTVATKRIT